MELDATARLGKRVQSLEALVLSLGGDLSLLGRLGGEGGEGGSPISSPAMKAASFLLSQTVLHKDSSTTLAEESAAVEAPMMRLELDRLKAQLVDGEEREGELEGLLKRRVEKGHGGDAFAREVSLVEESARWRAEASDTEVRLGIAAI